MPGKQKITTFLWFDGNAEEAVNHYVSIFKNSKILSVARYGEGGPGPKVCGKDREHLFGDPGQGRCQSRFQFRSALHPLGWVRGHPQLRDGSLISPRLALPCYSVVGATSQDGVSRVCLNDNHR